MGKVWISYLLYKYDVCYELIERAYIEVEKAEEHGVTDTLFGTVSKIKLCRANQIIDYLCSQTHKNHGKDE